MRPVQDPVRATTRRSPLTYLLLAGSFAALLVGAMLFTNAVEWLGRRLSLGEGPVGSVLAGVATALPESLIPVVAIAGGAEGAGAVATGAIVGAPFMLATIAMALVGLSALAYRGRRRQGRSIEVDAVTLRRDLAVFLACFAAGLVLGLGAPLPLRALAAAGLVIAYLLYLRRTLRRSAPVEAGHGVEPLLLDRRRAVPRLLPLAAQLVLAMAAIVGGAHLFVEELLHVAHALGVDALVLSLVLAPLATELPEKANSVIWMRQGKDTLALGNITGAMVFQATIPVAIGLAFTDWELDRFAAVAAALGLAGGLLALVAIGRRRFGLPHVAAWGGLYAVFALLVALD